MVYDTVVEDLWKCAKMDLGIKKAECIIICTSTHSAEDLLNGEYSSLAVTQLIKVRNSHQNLPEAHIWI